METQTVRIVWTVENMAERADVLVSLDEAAAVDFAKAQPTQFTGHYVVRRSHLIAGSVV